MSIPSAHHLSPPVIRLEQMTHQIVMKTFHGYFQQFAVRPAWFVRGWVRWVLFENEKHGIEVPDPAMHLGIEHAIVWWSRAQALLCIRLGDREVYVEPMVGEIWDQVIFHPPTRSLLTGEKGDVLQSNGC